MDYILQQLVGLPDIETYPHLEEFYYIAALILSIFFVGFVLRMMFALLASFFNKAG